MKRISLRANILLLASLPLGACASGMPTPSVDADDIPALEAAAAAAPESADTLTLLGVAYYDAARFDDAARVLTRAVSAADAQPLAYLYLGLTSEAGESWQAASDAYKVFLAEAPSDSRVRPDVVQRIALVERQLMAQQLVAMLAQEDVLARQAAVPLSVAVFPFRVVTDDPRYQPLQAALADMVTTDLGIPGTLQLLERSRIQALVQEMALSLAGYTDAGSGARVGRLMRAQHVVQGSVVLLGDERLRLEMGVVDPTAGERLGQASDEAALADIFDAEKRLVIEVLGLLGVTITAAEREAIEENRTGSLLALLSYGEGLDAMDRGDFGAASAAFENAARIDPGFQAAQTRGAQAAGLQRAAQTTGSQIAAIAQAELPAAVPETPASGLVDQVGADVNRSGADDYAAGGENAEVASTPTIDDQNTNSVGGTSTVRVRIPLDNPNPQ